MRRKDATVKANRTAFHINLPIAGVLHSPRKDWNSLKFGKTKVASGLEKVDWKKFNDDNYLFTHATIVASVELEENGYHVKPSCSSLVNNNGNSWSNEILLATFNSFRGAENYLEHVQIPELSKGKILDACLRPVNHKVTTASGEEQNSNVYYCDILVATDRQHVDIVPRIEKGELNALSMGCIANVVTCSKCGGEFGENQKVCDHIEGELLTTFRDDNGVERIVSELCGRTYIDENGKRVGDPDSVQFIEASWVENPAFKGAVINHYLSEIPETTTASLENLFDDSNVLMANDLFKLRVADEKSNLVLKVARDYYKELLNRDLVQKIASDYLKQFEG